MAWRSSAVTTSRRGEARAAAGPAGLIQVKAAAGGDAEDRFTATQRPMVTTMSLDYISAPKEGEGDGFRRFLPRAARRAARRGALPGIRRPGAAGRAVSPRARSSQRQRDHRLVLERLSR